MHGEKLVIEARIKTRFEERFDERIPNVLGDKYLGGRALEVVNQTNGTANVSLSLR